MPRPAPRKPLAPFLLLGVDPSIAATGYAALLLSPDDEPIELVAHGVVRTTPDAPLPDRAALLAYTLRRTVREITAKARRPYGLCAVEDFARNSRFRREEMGVAAGAVFIALHHADAPGGPASPVLIPPRTAKAAVCPHWYGWSKAAWAAANMPPPFKRSMPSKTAVNAALWSRFSLRIDNEHAADAACVALAAAMKYGLLPT